MVRSRFRLHWQQGNLVHQIVELTVLQTTCACFPNGKYARHGCSFSSFPRAWLVESVRAQPCTNHMRVIAFFNKQYSCAISNPISNQGSTFSGQRLTFLKVKISIKLHRTIMKKKIHSVRFYASLTHWSKFIIFLQ